MGLRLAQKGAEVSVVEVGPALKASKRTAFAPK